MLKDRFESAMTLEAFIDRAEVNQELWRSLYRRARPPEDLPAPAG